MSDIQIINKNFKKWKLNLTVLLHVGTAPNQFRLLKIQRSASENKAKLPRRSSNETSRRNIVAKSRKQIKGKI